MQPGVWADVAALAVVAVESLIFLIPFSVLGAEPVVPEEPVVQVECLLFPSRAVPGAAEADRIPFSYPAHGPWK